MCVFDNTGEAKAGTGLSGLLESIERKKALLASCRPLTRGEAARLTEDFAVEYTYNSNAIEGNTLTLRETDRVLRGLTVAEKPLKDHLEAVGHKEAFDFVVKLVREKKPLSQSLIKQVHFLLLADKKDDREFTGESPCKSLRQRPNPSSCILSHQKWKHCWRILHRVRHTSS